MHKDKNQGELFGLGTRLFTASDIAARYDREEITANALSVELAALGFFHIKFNPVRASYDGVEYPLGV